MTKFLKIVPMAVSGLALGLASLGNLLLPFGASIRYICGSLSFIILLLFILKFILDFPFVREELKKPVPLSVLPTSTMALMLLCTYIRPFFGDVALIIWYVAVLAHVSIMVLFFVRFILRFKIENVFPSWFVAFVGLVTVSVTAPAMNADRIGQFAFYIGFSLYFIALMLNVYRLTGRWQISRQSRNVEPMQNSELARIPEPLRSSEHKQISEPSRSSEHLQIPESLRPTLAIFTAPMSLCLVGYFSSFEQQNEYLVYSILCFAIISYIFVTYKMITELLRTKFYPTYAAFTFPYVISATAFRFGSVFLAERGFHFFTPVAQISMWIAVVVVIYVLVRYIMFFRGEMK